MSKLAQSWHSSPSRLLSRLGFFLSICAVLGVMHLFWERSIWLQVLLLCLLCAIVLLYGLERLPLFRSVTLSCTEGIYCLTEYAQAPQVVHVVNVHVGPGWIYMRLLTPQGKRHLIFWRYLLGEHGWRSLKLQLQSLFLQARTIEKDAI